MGVNPSYDSITKTLSEILTRLGDLENGTRLGNSAINQGAIIARDAGGVARARYGQLLDGSFGLQAERIIIQDPDTGQTIPLAQALFGIGYIDQPGVVALTPAATLDWSPLRSTDWATITLSGTGLALVMGSVKVGYTGVNEVAIGLEVVNDATSAVIIAPSVAAGAIGMRVPATSGVTLPLVGRFTGPANTKVRVRLRYDSIGSSGTAEISSAGVIVWPT